MGTIEPFWLLDPELARRSKYQAPVRDRSGSAANGACGSSGFGRLLPVLEAQLLAYELVGKPDAPADIVAHFSDLCAAPAGFPEDRISHVLKLQPAICSLDVATMNFGAHAFVNTPDHIARVAVAVRAAGVKPALEVFDLGHITLARNLIGKGLFDDPPYFQLCLGVPRRAPAKPDSTQAMKSMLPANANWSAFGVGAQHFPCVAISLARRAQRRGGLLRLETSLERELSELAILDCGRHWTSHHEWTAHKCIALQEGLDPRTVEGIAARVEMPYLRSDRERIVFLVARTLLAETRLDDSLHADGEAVLGEIGMVDLVAILGYYCMVALKLNAFQIGLADSVAPDLLDAELLDTKTRQCGVENR